MVVNVMFFSDRDYIFLLQDSFWVLDHLVKYCPAAENVISATERRNTHHQKCNIHHSFYVSFKILTQTQI